MAEVLDGTALELAANLAELDERGLTVVRPDIAGTADLASRLLARITEIATDRGGIAPDFVTGSTHAEITSPDGQLLKCLMAEGAVFEEALLHPAVLTLARHLIGAHPVLFTARAILKGPGQLPLFLHADQQLGPTPTALVCNVTIALTDYTRENGALCFVPGSHRAMRQPTAEENFSYGGTTFEEAFGVVDRGGVIDVTAAPGIVAVQAPAGSLIAWHGNTWHGAFQRTAPGIRASFILVFANRHLRPQEPYPDVIPPEAFARHDEEFATLVGHGIDLG